MSTEIIEVALRDFKRSVEITRDVRFQANLRLSGRQRASSYVVSSFSLYVIGLSLIPNIIKLQENQSQILLACSIILSVFVIFTSLIDGAQNFYHQGELLHHCARKIASIHYALKNIDINKDADSAHSELARLQGDYKKALDECPINHENVDFYRELGYKPHLFPSHYPWKIQFIHRWWYRLFAFLLDYSWLFTHIIAGVAVSWVVIKYVVCADHTGAVSVQ